MPYDKIDQLYDALKADGAVSKDRKNFRNVMLAPGKDGYQNRKRLFDALKADGAVDSNSYEEFAQRLGLHAVKPAGQKAPHAGTPMTAAEREEFAQGAQGIVQQAQGAERRAHNAADYAKGNMGLRVKPSGLGFDRKNVVQKGNAFIDSEGNEHNTRAEASITQGKIDEENEKRQDLTGYLDKKAWQSVNTAFDKQHNEQERFKEEHPYLSAFSRAMQMFGGRMSGGQGGNVNQYTPDEAKAGLATLALNQKTRRMEDEGRRYGHTTVLGRVMRGMGAGLSDAGTYDFGISDTGTAVALKQAAERYEAGKATADDEMLLEAASFNNETAAKYAEALGGAYGAGQNLVGTASFMAQIASNPASATGKATANKVARIVARRAIEKYGSGLARKAVTALAKGATRLGADALEAGVVTAMYSPTKIVGDYAQRKTGDIYRKEDGTFVFEGREHSDIKALAKAINAQNAENLSEMWGDYLPGVGKLGGIVGKGLRKVGAGKIVDAFEHMSTSAWAKTWKDFTERTKWNGTAGEYFEEVMNNVYNAITNGDMTLDSNPQTGVFNGKRNLDTLESVGLMTGIMSSIKTGGYMRAKYVAARDQRKADLHARAAFGNERWEAIKEMIDSADDKEMGNVMSKIGNDTLLSDDQKMAVLNYQYRTAVKNGANAQDLKNKLEGNYTQSDEAYDAGYNAEGAALTDAKTAYELQQQKIAEKYGEDATAYADDNPVGYLHQLQQQGADEEVQGDFLAYINAKSAFDGVIQRAQDDLDDRITESGAMIDSRVHRQDGAIHPATMKYKDRKVYVVSGNVVMSDDGTMVDNTQSDDTLIIRDAETGELEFSDPASILSVDETIDPEEEKAAAAEAITQTFGKERADQIDGVLPMLQGDTYNIVDDEGKPHTVQVVQNNGDGSLAVMPDGAQEAVPMTAEQLQAWADNANVQRVRQQEEEAVAALQPATTETETGNGRPTYSINDEITLRGEDGLPVRGSVGAEENADGLIEVYTESPIKGKKVNMFTRDELDGMLMQHNGEDVNAGMGVAGDAGAVERPQEDAQESAPENAGKSALQDGTTAEPMPMIGEGEDAEPDFSRVDPARAHTYIYNEAGLDREEGNEFVAANLKEAQKALDKAKKGEPKMGTSIAKYRKEQAAYGQIVGEAQKVVDYWNGVKAEQDKIVAEESRVRAEQQAEETRKAVEAERQRKKAEAQKAAEQAEVGTHNVAPAIKEKWDAARKSEGAANEIVLPNGEKVAGRYVLVESGAASPSHNATNEFTKTEGFPIDENGQSVNDRDYERDKDAQRITRNIASDYDSRAMQSPVVVSRDGVVLSGNGRTMAGELAATNNTDGAYIEHLQKYPQQYGFTPEQVQGMEHPRVLFVPDADMPYTAETFAKYNQQEMKGQSKTEHAVKLGKVVDDATFNRIIRLMNQYDTLGDFYADSKATHDAIGELQTAGVVAPAQVAEMFDGDGISAQGREMLENMLIGKAFESNPDAVRQITAFKSMRQSVITALAEISNNKALGDGYSLEKELADAIALVYNARNDKYKAGERVSEYARQGNLFQLDDGATVADFTNATTMMLADVLNDNRSTQLKKILAVYNHNAADSAAGQMDMFSGGVLTKRDILNEVKQLINYGTEQQQTEAIGQAVERRKAESIQQDGDTRGSGKKEPAYRLSDEVDENGRQFVLTSEGKLEFGELGAETGLPPAPIMLSEGIITNPKTNDGYGLVHIEARHGEQIRNAGYSSVLDFIEEVAKHYEVIKEGKNRNGNQTYMLQLTDKHNNTLMVEMSADGNYWNINTAGIFKTSYGKNRKEVYNRHTTAKQPAGTVGVSQDSEQDGTQKSSSMNTPSTSSASKDSKSSEIKQKYEDIFAKAERIARESEVKRKITEAEKETDVNPTEAQKEAGNYKKGHVTVDGLDVTIEQPKGSVRRGKDADGKEWESEMHNTYGYIKGAEGVDGDHIDIFLSDNPASGHVFVVDQVNPKTGEFDEHKVMYGFDSAEEAKQAYLSNYEKGWKGLGDITEVTKEKFKKWVDSSKRKTKPFAEYKNVKGTSDVNEAATASQRTERTGGKQVGADVPAMTEEKYLASKGLGSPMSDYMLDKMRIPHGETARQMAKRKQEAERAMEEHAAQKEAARKEYREKIANGELREPTKEEAEQKRIDALVKTANGHDDNPSVQAARRVLDKRGIEWKKNEDIFTRAERIAQDVANKKKLEKREPTKAGKIPQEEKEDLLSQKEYVDNGMSSALEQTQYKTLEEWEDKDTEDYARKYDDFLADYTNYINDFAKGETLQALYDKSSVKVQKEIRRHIEDAGLDYHDILDTSPGRIRIQDRLTKKMKYAKGEFSDGTIVAGEVVSQTPTSLVINSRGRKYTIKAGSVLEQSDEPIASGGILFRDGEQEYTKEERELIANAKADGSYMKAPNGKSTKLTEHQWVQVRTKAFKEWFGDWEKAARIEKLRKSKAVKITGEEIVPSDDLKQYKKNALEYGKKLRGEYTNEDTGESIALTGGNSRGGIREILQHDYKDTEHLQSIAAIPQIIEKSIFIDDIPNEDVEKYSGVKSFRYYVCGLKIGNNDYTVKAVVAVQNNGDRYYDHKLSRIEKGKLLSIIPTIQKAGIENNLPPSIGKDKRLFSILQTNSSKVLDENGEPMVVYHGTNTEFTAFDRKKAGAGNDAGMRGKGFYLSPNKRTSENYGQRIISAFVSLKNPFIPFSFSSSKEIAEYLGVEEDTFRFEPNSEFKVYPAFSGLITSALKDKGYDGVLYLHRQEIVAFRPDQIKSATENNGEFDSGNDDIRFRTDEVKAFADTHNLDTADVAAYEYAMSVGNNHAAHFALSTIRRKQRTANRSMKLSEFGKMFYKIRKGLYEQFGDLDALDEEYRQKVFKERGLMEAARKREEEERKRQREPIEALMLLTPEERDAEYMRALEAKDENRMREVLQAEAQIKGYSTDADYQGEGTWIAPSNPGYETAEERRAAVEEDSPDLNIDDLAHGYTNQPDDIFTNLRAYGNDNESGRESGKAITDAIRYIESGKGMPKVTVYRAVPTSVKENGLRSGDWVTPSKSYAKMHGESRLEGDYRIIEQEVPADELWWDSNDIREWGFDNGKDYAYKNTENGRKLNDLVTKDDNGNVIPPSKRFNEKVADERFRKTEQAGYTAKQREEYDLRQRRRIQDAARETASKLGIGDRVTMMETADGLTGRRAKAKGWFDTETGKIVVVLGNHRNREDVMQTILHEGVAHYGLRQLFGPHFDTFLDNILLNADEDVRRAIVEMAAKHGWDFRTATEEYLAGLAEDTDFERAMNRGWFNRIKDLFLKMLHKIGFEGFIGVDLSDNELRYILWRSYENLTEPGRYRSILGEAADVDMQSRLKVGNYQVQQTGDGDLAAEPAPIGNGAFGPIYDQFRGKAKEAISFLTRKKAGEAVGALHHKDIGDIDLVWGNGKAGLAHILSKHPNVLDGIQDFINEMEVVQSSENRIVIESDSHRAVISKMLGQEKTPQWLLTAYAKKNATGGSSDIDPEPNQGKQNGTAPLQGNSSSANIGNVLESSKEPDEKVLFRDGGEPQRTAREIYEDAVKDSGEATMLGALSRTLTQDGRERFKHKLSESHFDYTRSIKQMQDAISKALGIKIESFEDVWRNLNAKGSIDAQEINMTMLRYIAPLAEHIGGMLKGKKLNGAELTQDDVEVYMNAVHGIERNAAMAKRELERIVDNKLEVWMEARTQELLAQGYNHDEAESIVEAERESQYKEEAKKVANKVRKDYAGLTALFGDEVEASGGKRTDIGKLEEAARKYAQEFESVIGKEQTDEMWNLVKALNDFSLRKAYMSGLIGKKQYDETRTMYTHYVPLRGWHDDFAGDIYQYISRGESKEVLQNVLKKAYGRQSRAGNIMGTMAAMANTAIVQGNKNLVAQKFLNLALNFGDKSGLLAVSRQWYEKNANGELIPLHPELRDNMTADEMQRAIEEFDARMEAEKKNGNTRLVKRTFGQDMPMHIAKWQEQQHSVRVLRNGVEYQVYVLGNPKAAQAFNGALLKNSDYGKVQEVWMNWMRLKATMQTSLSPEFLFSNFQRDILTAGTGTYIKFGWKAGTAFADNLTKVMPVSGLRKGHAGGIFELLRKYNNGTLDKTNEMERMFDEFVRGGGMTGISSITKNEEYERQMAKMMKRVNRGSLDMPRKAWQGLADGVEFLNSGIENATRFAAYMTSRKTLGKSVAESVFDAKEASVNFNMKGSGAWGNLWIRRNILYANPALQALRMLGTWYEASPARFMKAFATILAASVGTAALWAYIGGDGDDDDWWKLNEWNRYNYINIRTKGGYAHWSIPQEFRPIWALGQIVFDWQQGKITPSIAINSMITQLNNISPMAFFAGGLDSKDSFWKTAIKAWTPTIAEDFADVYHWNENFLGQKITGQSDWNKDAPEWKRAGKNTPEWAVGISRKWNEATGGRRNLKSWWDSEYLNPSAVYYILQQQTGGMGTMVTKLSKAYEQWQDPDEEVEPKNIPFVSKFWVTTGDDDSKNRVVNDKFWMFYNDWKLTDYEIKHNQSDVRKGDMTLGELAEDMSEIKADGSFDRWRKLQ
ncbi:LPD38 domain-containing protein, partial [Lancefieldella rimae]|uniref:ADP-ribosyltransferase-containing protein n=1 Tax=Lancefieldella rimae TaxID=1383 RepID=UPI003A8D8C10